MKAIIKWKYYSENANDFYILYYCRGTGQDSIEVWRFGEIMWKHPVISNGPINWWKQSKNIKRDIIRAWKTQGRMHMMGFLEFNTY